MNQNKKISVESLKKTKIETTYEYVPILGEILGYWRTKEVERVGETIELKVRTPIEEYDRVIINGKEIKCS